MSQSEEVVPAGMTDTNTASAAAAAADTIPPPPEPESEQKMEETTPKKETETDTDTVESQPEPPVVISNSRNSRPTYRYDPNKITLRFLFANRDGLTVTVTCNSSDTVGQVKESLISVWPEDLPKSELDTVRLVCMGKGYLSPDTRTLQECNVPVFKTHPTPINVSVKPKDTGVVHAKKSHKDASNLTSSATTTGCGCSIQ